MNPFYEGYEARSRANQPMNEAVNQFVTGQRNKKIGNALAGGDYAGAAKSAFEAGDLDRGTTFQTEARTREKEQLTQRVTALGKVTDALLAIPDDPTNPQASLAARKQQMQQQILPMLGQLGLNDPQLVQQLQTADLSTQSLTTFRTILGEEARKLQFMNLGNGFGVAIDEGTGRQVNEYRGPLVVDQKQNVYLPDSMGGAASSPQSPSPQSQAFAPVAGAPPAPPQPFRLQPQAGETLGQLASRAGGSGMVADIARLAPNAIVTSAYRDPRHNADVGGVTDSYHMKGEAFDLTPTGGQTMAQLAASLRGSGYDVINEGNHVHVEPSARMASQPYQVAAMGDTPPPPSAPDIPGYRRVQSGAPKQEDAPSGYRWRSDGSLEAIPNGPADPGSPSNTKASRKTETDLRKEFRSEPDVKAFYDVAASYDIISRIANAPPTAANDMSLIFAYMKMLDPGSVVREGEFANAQNTAGVPEQVLNAYNRALSGQRLNPNQRQQFASTGARIYESRKARYDQIVGDFREYAADYGVDPERVVQERIAVNSGSAQAPATQKRGPSGRPMAPAQNKTAQRFKGSKAAPGSPGNPYVTRNKQDYDTMPSGAHYIFTDGRIMVKP